MSKGSRKKGKQAKVRYDKQQKRADREKSGSPKPQSGKAFAPIQPTMAAVSGFTPVPSNERASTSEVVTLQPLAPMIIRSGRPFDAHSGTDSARFPPPSTVAGCLRTAWARANDRDFGPELAEMAITGPLLVRSRTADEWQWLLPRPADAQYFQGDSHPLCVRSVPAPYPAGAGSDLPAGLSPVMLQGQLTGKAIAGPQWWDSRDFLHFRGGESVRFQDLEKRGWSVPSGDQRTHVAIDRSTGAAESARLFQTEGLDLEADNPGLRDTDTGSLRLLVRCAHPMRSGLVHLGGERRLAQLQPRPRDEWPEAPKGWWRRIREARGLSLTLITPAVFANGFRPAWLNPELCGVPPDLPGLELRLKAVALERRQAHSGWDLALQAPRVTRRLVPSGAVYWFQLLNTPSDEALASLWLQSVSDDPQDRRDGFGVAIPAPWAPTV